MKFKRFLRKFCRPIFLGELVLSAVILFLLVFLLLYFSPDSFAASDSFMKQLSQLPFSPATIVHVIFFFGLISGYLLFAFVSLVGCFADWLVNFFSKRRNGVESVKDNLIQVYVDDCTYDRLLQIIEDHNVTLPEFCAMVLECVDLEDLDKARNEWLDGTISPADLED